MVSNSVKSPGSFMPTEWMMLTTKRYTVKNANGIKAAGDRFYQKTEQLYILHFIHSLDDMLNQNLSYNVYHLNC